jgi:SpoIID/LytB domain protein
VPRLVADSSQTGRVANRTKKRVAFAFAASTLGALLCAPVAHADSTLIIDGRGFGHGVGMAQDGAYWLGRSGRSASQILQTFYPGTTLSNRGGAIRVPLATAGSVTFAFPGGGNVGGTRVPAGSSATVTIRGGGWSVAVGGRSSGETGTQSTQSTQPTPEPAEPAAEAPAAGLLVAVVSPARLANAALSSLRALRAFRTQTDPATVTVPVVEVPATQSAPAPAPVTPAPVQVANPVGPTPVDPSISAPTTTTAQPTPAPIAAGTPEQNVPVVVANPDPVVVTPVDPTATSVPTSENPTQAQDGEQLNEEEGGRSQQPIGARIEVTSKGLIGLGGRRFRGTMELQNRGGSIKVVNIVDVEQYLLGMGEILSRDWPAATLQAQAIAARTYAIRMMGTRGEVCPTQACQVYLGAQVEYPQMNAAVAATRGKVVVYKGKLAVTYYSASGGGTVADPSEGFGGDAQVPYLQAGTYPTGDLKSWTVTMSLREAARRVGYRGSPSSVAITKLGPSGRAKEVTFYGSAGALKVAGPRFDAALGLRSTFFTFRGSAVGMSPLPSDVGAASAVEVVVPGLPGAIAGSDSGGSGGGFAPTEAQSPNAQFEQTEQTGQSQTGESTGSDASSFESTETSTAPSETVVLTTVPASLTSTAPTTITTTAPAAGRANEVAGQVTVIDGADDDNADGTRSLLLLGAAMAALLGTGAVRQVVLARRRRRR